MPPPGVGQAGAPSIDRQRMVWSSRLATYARLPSLVMETATGNPPENGLTMLETLRSKTEALDSLEFGVTTCFPSKLTQWAWGKAGSWPGAWVKYDLITLVPSGSSSTIRFPPLFGMISVFVPGRRITCDGDGPTSVVCSSFPLAMSMDVILFENHWFWNKVFWSAVTPMLWGLFMLIPGRNIFRVISHVDVSKLVIEPGFVLPADSSNWVSSKTVPTPWTSGFFGGVSVCGR